MASMRRPYEILFWLYSHLLQESADGPNIDLPQPVRHPGVIVQFGRLDRIRDLACRIDLFRESRTAPEPTLEQDIAALRPAIGLQQGQFGPLYKSYQYAYEIWYYLVQNPNGIRDEALRDKVAKAREQITIFGPDDKRFVPLLLFPVLIDGAVCIDEFERSSNEGMLLRIEKEATEEVKPLISIYREIIQRCQEKQEQNKEAPWDFTNLA
ncbi:hypothetical protein BBP40_005860 [Aspergillus hancockii]|nr:hypothetical protein BBP40_005860 [Aspergillus hancockii]